MSATAFISLELYRGVGFVKINAHCTLMEGDTEQTQRLKGICFLKGDSVTTLVALHCDDGTVHSLLVEQPRYVLLLSNCV